MTSAKAITDKERTAELEQLIREQRRDDTKFIRYEEFVSFSLDAGVGEHGTFQDLCVIGDSGSIRMPSRTRTYGGCAVHGRGQMVEDKDGAYRCKRCRADRAMAWRRRKKAETAEAAGRTPAGQFPATGPQCGHDPSRFSIDNSPLKHGKKPRTRCNECQRLARRRREANAKSSRK